MSMKRQLILIACLVLVGVVGAVLPAAAQLEAPQLATWDVQIWPEYDDPSVLVIATGAMAEGSALPQTLRIPLPPGARVHAVAYPDETGNLLTLPWTSEAGADGQTVVLELNQPRFVVEYYADILSPPPSRSFALDLTTPYAVQQASLALRQPARASDLQVTPAMTAGAADNLGNPTYGLELGALPAGERIPVQVSYTKADGNPSVASAAADAPAAAAPPAAASDEQAWLPLALGITAGILVGAGVIFLLMQRRSAGRTRQARRRDARNKGGTPARPPASGAAGGAAADKFCVKCGQKFEGADRFCRNCGTARR